MKAAPKGVQVVNKNGYLSVKVKLDLLVEKSVPITINVIGNTKPGYGYVQPVVRPTEALISGAATYVNSVASAYGQIDITDTKSDISSSIPIKGLDNEGRVVQNITIEPKFIDVFIPVKPSKTVPIEVKTKGELPKDKVIKYIRPKFSTLTILGDINTLSKINSISTQEFDISNLTISSTKDVPLNIPQGIDIFGGLKSINIDFVVENKVEKTLTLPINVVNKNDDYNYVLEKEYIEINILGPESKVNEKDIAASVDVKDLGEGTHILPIKLDISDDIKIKNQSMDKVSVLIQKK